MLLGNFAQWDGFAHAGARVQDVDPALHPLDRIEQAVEVVEIGRVAAHAGHVPADQLDGLIQRLLPPAGDENVGAFFNEPLGARQRHAARSTRDDCDLTFKLSHDFLLQAPSLVVRGGHRDARDGLAGVRRSVRKRAHRWCKNDPAGRQIGYDGPRTALRCVQTDFEGATTRRKIAP